MLLLASGLPVVSHGLSAAGTPAGRYRLVGEGPDVASALILAADGSFEYFLAAGALDEHARGRWIASGKALHLTTIPTPVAPVFTAGPVAATPEGTLVLRVTGPGGSGIAGVDIRIGFATGADVEGYTQEDGWTMPAQERRTPRWVEFAVPMHRLRSRRFPIDLAKGTMLTFVLTPNDLGEIDFTGMPIDLEAGRIVMHRDGALLTYTLLKPPRAHR